MKVSIDTKEDSHEEIKKVIKMLQNLVGDSGEVFTNEAPALSSAEPAAGPFTNIFGDSPAPANPLEPSAESTTAAETPQPAQEAEPEDESESTEDLFAELFSEEELKKMDVKKEGEEEGEEGEEGEEAELKPKGKKYSIEFY